LYEQLKQVATTASAPPLILSAGEQAGMKREEQGTAAKQGNSFQNRVWANSIGLLDKSHRQQNTS
jgi:hypothetical protein